MSLHLSWIEKNRWQDLLVCSGLIGGIRVNRPLAGTPPTAPAPTPTGTLPAKPTAPTLSPPSPLEGTLEQRLVLFYQWIKSEIENGLVFIADEHGLSIAADDDLADFSAASSSACHCLETFKVLAGGQECEIMTLTLSPGEHLHIIGGRISWGWFTAGLITPTPLPNNAIRQIRDVFVHQALGSNDQGDLNE